MNTTQTRLCLFAGYSQRNSIDSNTIHYIRELSRSADVFYLSADDCPEQELARLDGLTKGCWSQRHNKYDFGSWQKLMFRLGWDHVSRYDHLIIANDSNLGPLRDLDSVFSPMEALTLDAWGITENYGVARHMQSYFVSFAKATIAHPQFRNFFESITEEASKLDVCRKYEIGLSEMLGANGLSFSSFIDRSTSSVPVEADITAYQNTLIRLGSPFVKRKVFTEPGFAEEDTNETRALLGEIGYPGSWLAALKSTQSQTPKLAPPRAADDAPSNDVAKSPEGGGVLRTAAKSVFAPLYRPFKARVVDPLRRVERRVADLAEASARLEEVMATRRSDVVASRPDAALTAIQGQLASLYKLTAKIAATPNIDDDLLRELTYSRELMKDLATSANELHVHIDWVQRDILLAILEDVDLSVSAGFKCSTQYPVAYDSPDHIHPIGALLDHTRHPRFIRACEDFLGRDKKLSFLDLGCSAGGLVLDAILRGHIGVGLEGSDISRLQQRAEWRLLRDNLFTCDITRPFDLTRHATEPYQFDVVSAWEVLEHLTSPGVDGMFQNIARHTCPGSLFACSISQVGGGFTNEGAPLHQTLKPLPWWQERAGRHGFRILDDATFARLDFARGSGNPSIYFKPEHSYREQKGDCILVVFQRQ